MKDLKKWIAGLALLAWSGTAVAQDERDALRYSQLGIGGTARIQGIAGAQTALGADASTMAGNPAGLGLYRKGEFTFTPGINFNETESALSGVSTKDNRAIFNIAQLGLVFADRKADEVLGDWRAGAFGIGFTRLNNFQTRTSYEGPVTQNRSILQSFMDNVKTQGLTRTSLDDEINGGDDIFSLEGLAYATVLLDFEPSKLNAADSVVVFPRTGALIQGENIITKGAQNQWDFSYGASYKDKLFIGASLALQTIRFEQQRTYSEASGNDPYFTSLILSDNFTTKGSGINFKIGAIYKPIDALRLGASIQTPTFISLTDNYDSRLDVTYKEGTFSNTTQTKFSAATVPGTFEYNLVTPFRANGGVAYFIGKYGFISADVEYVNYNNASFNQEDDNGTISSSYFRDVNRKIEATYQSAVNYRIGGEARFDIFRVRAGFGYYSDPYRNSNLDRDRTYFTGGIGVKEKNYFIDAAYVQQQNDSYYSPYSLTDKSQPIVATKNNNTSFLVTLGVNF